MSEKNTGGPAFPAQFIYERGVESLTFKGMTLRDYFAAKAMPPLIVAFTEGNLFPKDDGPVNETHIAEQAYAFADAMLKAREA